MNYKILVNENNLLTKNILNSIALVKFKNDLGEYFLVEKKTLSSYKRLKESLESKGVFIDILNAYQESISNEIGTGLLIEIITNKENISFIKDVLANFGFILREYKDSESIKVRYVGISTAKIIYNEDLTLEKYHQIYDKSGILLVNKPSGVTSREVDNRISRKFDTKKVGHTGTLDPLASGVLIVLIGNATKISSDITSEDKSYIATVRIGVKTDTLDITGNVLERDENYKIDNLSSLLKSFEKTYMQEVPIYSAVKVDGKKLYEYARSGKDIVLPKKEVTIKKIELLSEEKDTFTFKCVVSKGTYIRSLIRDMGNSIQKNFTMESLVRIEEAGFKLDKCFTLEDIDKGHFEVLDIDKALGYPVIILDEDTYKKVSNGCVIKNKYHINNKVIFKYNKKLVAIYEKKDDQLFSYRQFT